MITVLAAISLKLSILISGLDVSDPLYNLQSISNVSIGNKSVKQYNVVIPKSSIHVNNGPNYIHISPFGVGGVNVGIVGVVGVVGSVVGSVVVGSVGVVVGSVGVVVGSVGVVGSVVVGSVLGSVVPPLVSVYIIVYAGINTVLVNLTYNVAYKLTVLVDN